MPTHVTHWTWDEAFSKFGFADGDGPNFTDDVRGALEDAGCTDVRTETWGMHNYMIDSLTYEGVTYNYDSPNIEWGYDDPRDWLPPALIKVLDETFTDDYKTGSL